MTVELLIDPAADAGPVLDAPEAAAPSATRLDTAEQAIAAACGRIAPVWPLKSFVAVNPFLGFTAERFEEASARMRQATGARMLMPRAWYREAVEAGRVTDGDLEAALAAAEPHPALPTTLEALKRALATDPTPTPSAIRTVAEVLDETLGTAFAALTVDEIGRWCAGYFDEGQAAWRTPWKALAPYPAWRAAARLDLAPETMGVAGFRAAIAELPEEPRAAIAAVLERLGLPEPAAEAYLHRALAGIGGWAAYARYLVWQSELYGESDDRLVQLLAVRVARDWALFAGGRDPRVRTAWSHAAQAMASQAAVVEVDPDVAVDTVLQAACERAFQRGLVDKLAAVGPAAAPVRPAVQAAFCIDVRSEVYRRALESVSPEVETIGFAGFFGFPIEYVPLGQTHGGAQCPVLLTPKFVVCEAVKGASDRDEAGILDKRMLRRRATKAWKAFKTSAVSSFAFVETLGLMFAPKLIGDSAGLTRTVTHPSADGLDADALLRLGPRLQAGSLGGRAVGFTPEQRVDMAEAVLSAMSLKGTLARLVMLAGHGSSTVNNPHAAGLDCGACGGHTGEANARVAAAILNDPEVRAGLKARGRGVADDVWFLGALHDTTTDHVEIFDQDEVPDTHRDDLARLKLWLAEASGRGRAERSALLGLARGDDVDSAVMKRSRDWAQVRPEWGLAGCAAFIAAPRERTRGVDLGGRSFLHSYDWGQDEGFGVLELIMTAPMVVASWINLQYYGSTVDNGAFGAGDKVLHNVVGTLGVLEGNGGDLKVGLPMQSLHDGRKLVHEPLRLSVLIEAPQAEIDRVIARHAGVRELVENGWMHLFRIDEDGQPRRYLGDQRWAPGA